MAGLSPLRKEELFNIVDRTAWVNDEPGDQWSEYELRERTHDLLAAIVLLMLHESGLADEQEEWSENPKGWRKKALGMANV